MNNVSLVGNIVRTTELKKSNSDLSIFKFTIAVKRKFKKEEADFLNIVTFGKTADNCEKYLKKGSKVAVSGSIKIGSYVNKEEVKIYTTDIIADNVDFISSKSDNASDNASDNSSNQSSRERLDDLPPIDEDLPF